MRVVLRFVVGVKHPFFICNGLFLFYFEFQDLQEVNGDLKAACFKPSGLFVCSDFPSTVHPPLKGCYEHDKTIEVVRRQEILIQGSPLTTKIKLVCVGTLWPV